MSMQMTATELNKMRTVAVPDPRTPEERKKTRRKIAKSKRKKRSRENVSSAIAANRDRRLAIATVVVLGLIMMGVIFVSAYCATIKHDINTTNKEVSAIQEDIDYLKIEIESGSNIATIEKKALKDLDMIYPTADQFVYVEGVDAENRKDLAQAIKENAYEF